MRTTHAPIHTAVATATVTLLFIILSGVGSVAWAQETAPALTPADAMFTLNGNPSAGEICGEVGLTAYADGVLTGSSWNGGQEDPDLKVERTENVGDTWTIHWTSPDPLDAVIIRVKNTFDVYRYTPSTDGDSDLVVKASNTSMTFCIADPEAPEIESLGTVCEREAAKNTAEPIVSFAGPFEVVDGEVTESPKDGATLDFIQSSSSHDPTVAFTAPFPVVMVIIRSSPDVAIALDEPATTGSVAFDLNPGGEVMLCGLAVETLVSGPTNPPPPPDPDPEAPEIESLGTVCEREAAKDTAGPIVSFAGPFEIVDGEVTESPKDGATLDFIQSSSSHDTTVAFTAPFPVVMVIIRTSPDVAIALDEPATTGSVAFDLNPGGEVMLCGLAVETLVSGPTNPPPPPDPTVEVQAPVELLPVQITSGEGPPMRTTLMLVVFVLLAMASSITLLLRSRSD